MFFSPQEKKNKIVKYHFDDQERLDFGQGSQIQRPTNIEQVISVREVE